MRTLRARGAVLILAVLLPAACTPAPEPRHPVRFTVGLHDISLLEPEGWEHLDHGLEHRFHKGRNSISVADIGPVTRDGYLREMNRALALFREERLEDASAYISSLPLRSVLFSPRQWDEVSDAWYIAVDGGLRKPVTTNDVELAYRDLLDMVASRETEPLPILVERIMPELYFGAHREIAEQVEVVINDRPAVRLETWDRLSHDHRRGFLLVLDHDNLLVVRMELGVYEEMKPVFDALVASLSLKPDQGSTGSTS